MVSRVPVFLHCSDHNEAMTVLQQFQTVHEYGLPSRIRTDKGGENVDIAMFLCILCVGPVVVVQSLLERVHTMNVLKDCGGMYMMG